MAKTRHLEIESHEIEAVRTRLLKNSSVKPSGCREWDLGRNRGGYGQSSFRRKGVGAHRLSYAAFNGVVKQGLYVLHRCDNPPCINPKHLFLGTDLDNVRDMLKKGRDNYRKRQQTCGAGIHPMKGENVIFRMRKLKSGKLSPSRECKTCRCIRLGLTLPQGLVA